MDLSVWEVHLSPSSPRRVFEHIEELAATIAGDGVAQGLGVLEPILVRRRDGGGYEVIDGARRLRACQLLAERSRRRDYRIPARVYAVTDSVAFVMGQIANLERDEPKAYEVALGYQRLRDALRAELGEAAASARMVAGFGPHEKTQVHDYLCIAEALTPDVLSAAGLTDDAGAVDVRLLARLTKGHLHAAAKLRARSVDACVAALKARIDSIRDVAEPAKNVVAPPPLTPAERRLQFATETGFSVKLRTPAQMTEPDVARDLVVNELAPAMLAVVERGHGGARGDGFYAAVAVDHALLVIPSELESLSLSQLDRLAAALTTLRRRAGDALRQRRRVAARLGAA